jgi:transcriptional regulator with XRE-family HTH domain
MTQKMSRRKRKALGIRIKPKEGMWIKYQLGLRDISLTDFAQRQGVSTATVSDVLRGKRKSAPIEQGVSKLLGYPSFEQMIAAAHKGGAA